jgi:hypothetical protein
MFRRGRRIEPSPEAIEQAHQARGRVRHRRQLRRHIIAPLVIVGLLSIAVPLAVLLLAGPSQLGSVANCMSVFIIVPLLLVSAVAYLVIVAATYGLAKTYGGSGSALRATHRQIRRANLGMRSLSRRIAAPVIAFNARFAWLERFAGAQAADSPTDAADMHDTESESDA